MSDKKLSPVEGIKTSSRGLRGTLQEGLANQLSGAFSPDDQQLLKFHGMYQQDDRDRRQEREDKKMERAYSVMIRLRIPGGVLTAQQWAGYNEIAGKYSTNVLKITTRQTLQLHGILKNHIRPTIKDFHALGIDSISACGDVNRNVVTSAHPTFSPAFNEVQAYASQISELLKPKSTAYYDIWIDDEKLDNVQEAEPDPLYGKKYLPRKHKIAIMMPPYNDVDVYANDIGLIAIVENDELQGFNVLIGGGMSRTYGNPETYPRLATQIGYVEKGEKTLKAIYELTTVQRDFGNRADRKRARLKYTVDTMGVENFKAEAEKRMGFKFEKAKCFPIQDRSDKFGWSTDIEGEHFCTLFIENGRITNENRPMKACLLEIAKLDICSFRFTCNQNLILGNIKSEIDKKKIADLLKDFQITEYQEKLSNTRKVGLACVALPSCSLALAEAQRYLPDLLTKIEELQVKNKIEEEEIYVRMTGCPNGCSRPYIAEMAFTGVAPGIYHMYLGGDAKGQRMNRIYKEHLNEEQIVEEVDNWFAKYHNERFAGETFGDFTNRCFVS